MQEEEANEIADLLTFKLAVDRNLPLSACLLRVPGSTADFLHAEEVSVHPVPWHARHITRMRVTVLTCS